MTSLSLKAITRSFEGRPVVREVSLEIRRGEFFSVLGPSGCGKTTLLRLIAGFETPDSGRVALDGKDLTRVAPRERGIGMVFQNYALFPHMNVYRNVAYGLNVRRLPAVEIRPRVMKALESVRLGERATASVASLSGGEQQRVALARALVIEPAVLLLDEPLSNLDVALRLSTREELRALQRSVGITTVYVTHDQSEALALSDRLAVMRGGVVEQVGSPGDLYERPATPFVARFLGGSNLFTRADVALLGGPRDRDPGERGVVAVKAESIRVDAAGTPGTTPARLVDREYQGFLSEMRLQVSDRTVRALIVSAGIPSGAVPGASVGIRIDWSRSVVFPEGEP
jgi:ABC-type Fe3+/spermidine/putrescine transport system ATPase subunit